MTTATSALAPPPDGGPHLRFSPETFAAQFNRRPFYLDHDLCDHPLFALPRLVALAQSLPAGEVEYNAGKLPVNADYRATPHTGLSIEETIRRIEHCGSWMVLKRVQRDPAYGALLDALLDQIRPHSEPLVPGMTDRQGFVFISSPDAVTPFHMDNEYNFLLQIRGSKTVNMWDPEDRLVLPEQTLESFHANFVHRNLEYREEFQASAWVLPLPAGRAVHFPVNAPHWVQNGGAVSISFSITFDAPAAHRRMMLYRLNARLRRLGLQPTPVGTAAGRDRLKDAGYRTVLKLREIVTGVKPSKRA